MATRRSSIANGCVTVQAINSRGDHRLLVQTPDLARNIELLLSAKDAASLVYQITDGFRWLGKCRSEFETFEKLFTAPVSRPDRTCTESETHAAGSEWEQW